MSLHASAKRDQTSCTSFEPDTKGFSAVTSDIDGDKLLFFSVPKVKGFSCTVDGVKTPIYTADYGLMAIPVSKGVHNIRVSYAPEGLITGCICSLLGVMVLGGYIAMIKKVKKND